MMAQDDETMGSFDPSSIPHHSSLREEEGARAVHHNDDEEEGARAVHHNDDDSNEELLSDDSADDLRVLM
ncbi:hypothetical protein MA16_Dca009599 [Dendrobium catenatum]|uniref:Uncharacterized protein n=1 Tax=Dendrobium catenatum TaxID=906689 RepID=A0A2I0VS35_9ASPA|nr:hypothetical protein MA16_Dca009599 [Dendrobium catenatum]